MYSNLLCVLLANLLCVQINMYSAYIDYDPSIMTCMNNRKELYGPTNIEINSLGDITCKHRNGYLFTGFTSKDSPDSPVSKIYNGIVLYPQFETDGKLTINFTIGSIYQTVHVNKGETFRNILAQYIDRSSYNINTTKITNTNTYENISIDDPIYNSGSYDVKLDPFVMFVYNSSTTTLPASSASPPKINVPEGYEFVGWISDQGKYESINLSKITEPITFNANVIQKVYNVQFSECGDKIIKVLHGTTITKSNNSEFNNITCSREGYTFNGWKEAFTNKETSSLNYLCVIYYVIIAYIIYYIAKYVVQYLEIGVSKSGYSNSRK